MTDTIAPTTPATPASTASPAIGSAPAGQVTAPLTDPNAGKSWYDSLSEELRNEGSVKNFHGKPLDELVKSHVSAQRELGSRVRIPGPDASAEAKLEFAKKIQGVDGFLKIPDPNNPEEVAQFRTKMGVPITPEEYKIQPDAKVPVDPNMLTDFKKVAHALGLNHGQADALVKYEQSRAMQQIEIMEKQRLDTQETLKQTWGNDYDARLGAAQGLLQHFAAKYPAAAKQLTDQSAGSNLGNNSIVLMIAAELGKKYQETGIVQGTRSLNFGMTPEEAKSQIAEIKMNKAHPYHQRNGVAHREAVEKMEKLYNAAYPSGKE